MFLNKATWLMTKSCWNWLKWKFVNFVSVRLPGRRHSDRSWFCSETLEGDAEWEAKILELAGFLDLTFRNQSVRLTSRSCCRSKTILHLRSWYRCYRSCRTRYHQVGEEVEIVGIKETQKSTCTALKCSANCWTKAVLVRT